MRAQARAEARRLYEAKGATVPAARLTDASDDAVAPTSAPAREAAPVGSPGATRTPVAENTASRFMELLRVAFNAKDRAGLGRLIARGAVHDDRRSIVASVGLDPRGGLDDIEATIDQGFSFAEPVTVAVRGERLALTRMLTRTSAGDESARLSVNELDTDGCMARSLLFDEDEVVTALAVLDDWYLAGEGAPFAEAIRPAVEHLATFHARDWDALADHVRDTVIVDHRGLWPDTGAEGYVERMQSLVETSPDATIVARKLHVHGDAVLMTADVRATSEHGDRYEYTFHTVGRPGRFEYFDDDDFATALARLDELGTEAPAEPRSVNVENATTRLIALTLDLMNRAEWGALTALGAVADDVVRFDRRRTVSAPTLADSESFGVNAAGIYEVFGVVRPEPVAVRGERLALVRLHCGEAPAFTMQLLVVYELDDAGRIVREVDFDEDDLAAGVAELDARFYLGEGAPFQRVLRAAGRYAGASVAGDFGRIRDHLADDFVVVDRQPFGFGEGDREYFVDMRRLAEDDPDSVNRVLHVNEHALLAAYLSRPVTDDGTRYERSGCLVMGIDASDHVNRIEMYADDDFDVALDRLDELGAPTVSAPSPSPIENSATRLMQRSVEVATALRFDLLRELLADGFVRADHRTGVSAPVANGPDEFVTAYAAWFEVGFDRLSITPVAIRGDRSAMARLEWSSADGRTVGFLGVYETDSDGRAVRGAHFDEDDVHDRARRARRALPRRRRRRARRGARRRPEVDRGEPGPGRRRAARRHVARPRVRGPPAAGLRHARPRGPARGNTTPVRAVGRRRGDRALGAGRRLGRARAALRRDHERRAAGATSARPAICWSSTTRASSPAGRSSATANTTGRSPVCTSWVTRKFRCPKSENAATRRMARVAGAATATPVRRGARPLPRGLRAGRPARRSRARVWSRAATP